MQEKDLLKLPNVTLICIDCLNYGKAVVSIKKSIEKVEFEKVLFLTDVNIKLDGIETILIKKINSKKEYSEFIIKELYKYFDTDYCLIVQHDSWVLDEKAWTDEFFEYDYIGARWLYVDGKNCGNGGFSLRSKKLQTILGTDNFIELVEPEDEVIGRLYRRYLEQKYDVKYASDEICDKFSFELNAPYQSTFGFHGFFHEPYQQMVVIKREAAMGDIICLEPLLHYFYEKKYKVVLETLPQFENIFKSHYFPVFFPYQIDPTQLKNATRYNLDMSYETKPKQLRLKSYFEFCGIYDYELQNPKLSVGFDIKGEYKFFKQKYCVLHIDKIAQPHRNINDIDWQQIVYYLMDDDYTVFVLGKGQHEKLNDVIEMNTVNEQILMCVIGGADLFIGTDSGLSHIAVGFDVPAIIFTGSVNLKYVHYDMSKIIWMNNIVCNKPYCYHEVTGVAGQDCYIFKNNPPCTHFKTDDLINSINKLCESHLTI